MANYDFHYLPLEGKISGLDFQRQTEDAINDLGNSIKTIEVDISDIEEAVELSQNAVNIANNAESIAQDALDTAGFAVTSAASYASDALESANNAQTVATALTDIYNDAIEQGIIEAPAVDPTLSISGAAADAKVTGDNINSLKYVVGLNDNITPEIELYSINSTTGANTSSSYSVYYRTGGFYRPSHIKASSTRGTLKTRIYYYSGKTTDTFISASDFISNLDADVSYPVGANYVRISGFVDGSPDDPINLSAITVKMKLLADSVPTNITVLDDEVTAIQNELNSYDFENMVDSYVDTDVPYNLIPSNLTWEANKRVGIDGSIVNLNGEYASDYIPVSPSGNYLLVYNTIIHKEHDASTGTNTSTTITPLNRYQYAFYTADKTFVASTSPTSDYAKKIPETARYVRVTASAGDRIKYARLIYVNSANPSVITLGQMEYKKIPNEDFQKPLTGYENFEMVCFGDSITHGDLTGNDDGLSYVDYASHNLNAKLYNVGFGSSTAARVNLTGNGLFCFTNLCDCIVSDDPDVWDDLDTWASSGNETFAPHLARLKAIDWSKINAVSILYGANDWASNVPVGSDYNTTPTNYDGGIAYGIVKLLTKYPHLQIMILSPFYRQRTVSNVLYKSDDPNGAGLNMDDYANSLHNVQKTLHVPVVDSKNWCINYINILTLAPDGTHPRSDLGVQRLGSLFTNAVKANLSFI